MKNSNLGDEPILLIPHAGITAMVGLVGGVVAFSFFGPGGPMLVGLWAANNLAYLGKTKDKLKELPAGDEPNQLPPSPTIISDPVVAREQNLPTLVTPVAQYASNVAVLELPETMPTVVEPGTALDKILQSPYRSRIYFGAQRSGKSMLVAIASKQLADRGTKVYHLNLLSYSKEGLDEDAIYTQHCVRSVRGDISNLTAHQVMNLVEDAIVLVEEWWKQQNAILLVDEWAYLSAKDGQHLGLLQQLLGLIAGKMAALTSGGMKRTLAVWAVAPKMVAGNMTESGKAIKSMECVYVTVPPNRTVDWQGQGVSFDDQLFTQVEYNFAIDYPRQGEVPGAERIAFVGDRWLPLGTDPRMLDAPVTPVSFPEVQTVPEFTPPITPTVIPRLFGETEDYFPVLDQWIAETDPLHSAVYSWLKALGNGAEVTTSLAAQSAWAKTAANAGKIPDRKAETLKPVLDMLAEAALLKPIDNKTWITTLR